MTRRVGPRPESRIKARPTGRLLAAARRRPRREGATALRAGTSPGHRAVRPAPRSRGLAPRVPIGTGPDGVPSSPAARSATPTTSPPPRPWSPPSSRPRAWRRWPRPGGSQSRVSRRRRGRPGWTRTGSGAGRAGTGTSPHRCRPVPGQLDGARGGPAAGGGAAAARELAGARLGVVVMETSQASACPVRPRCLRVTTTVVISKLGLQSRCTSPGRDRLGGARRWLGISRAPNTATVLVTGLPLRQDGYPFDGMVDGDHTR